MKYALLIYSPSDEREYAARSADAVTDIVAYTSALKDSGALLAAEQLTHTDTA